MTVPEVGVTVALDMRALHDLVHASVHAQYDRETGWWSQPLETALVAVADARHAPGSRRLADTAYRHLTAWLGSDEPRALGDDATAAALTARAALKLHGGDNAVTARAVELVGGACRGNELALAPLHVALSAWALDAVVPDRHEPPWDDLRASLQRFSTTGINGAFVIFTRAVSHQEQPHCDARLTEVVPLDRTEECLLLWLVYAAVDIEFEHGNETGGAVNALLRRRAELLDQLSSELTPDHLALVIFDDYDPEGADEAREGGVGLFEAALLDLVLSGDRPQQALVTLEEAERLGAVALEEAERLGAVASREVRRRYASAAGVVALVVSALGSTVAGLARGGNAHLVVGVAIATLSLGWVLAIRLLDHADTRWDTQKLMAGLLGGFLLGAFLVIEGAWKVLVQDDIAAIIGVMLVGATFLLDATAGWLQKR